jgi:hypothetical protein
MWVVQVPWIWAYRCWQRLQWLVGNGGFLMGWVGGDKGEATNIRNGMGEQRREREVLGKLVWV